MLLRQPEVSVSFEDTSPDVVLSRLRTEHGHVDVVRDDLLAGGTKQRAAIPYLWKLRRRGIAHVVYASPFAGFAQVALAFSCARLGMACTLFCEADPATSKFGALTAHPFSALARDAGASVVLVSSLSEAESGASKAAATGGVFKIPLGFADPEFQTELATEIRRQWNVLWTWRRPRALWLPVGSGTLAAVFREVVPASIPLHCVDVRVLPETDERIERVRNLSGVAYHRVPETFPMRARLLPSVPSNVHYDAKLWQFIVKEAEDGDVWWNVAR